MGILRKEPEWILIVQSGWYIRLPWGRYSEGKGFWGFSSENAIWIAIWYLVHIYLSIGDILSYTWAGILRENVFRDPLLGIRIWNIVFDIFFTYLYDYILLGRSPTGMIFGGMLLFFLWLNVTEMQYFLHFFKLGGEEFKCFNLICLFWNAIAKNMIFMTNQANNIHGEYIYDNVTAAQNQAKNRFLTAM